jgi:hypothetical protein
MGKTLVRMPARMKAQIFKSMGKIWARMPRVDDSARIVVADRGR